MRKFVFALTMPVMALMIPAVSFAGWHHHRHHYYYYPVAPVVYQTVNPAPAPPVADSGDEGDSDDPTNFGSPDSASPSAVRKSFRASVAQAATALMEANTAHRDKLLEMKNVQRDILQLQQNLRDSEKPTLPVPPAAAPAVAAVSPELEAIQKVANELKELKTAFSADIKELKGRIEKLETPEKK